MEDFNLFIKLFTKLFENQESLEKNLDKTMNERFSDLEKLIQTQNSQPAELIPIEDAAKLLFKSISRIRQLCDEGVLPFYQDGPKARIYFKRSELIEWIESTKVTSSQHEFSNNNTTYKQRLLKKKIDIETFVVKPKRK